MQYILVYFQSKCMCCWKVYDPNSLSMKFFQIGAFCTLHAWLRSWWLAFISASEKDDWKRRFWEKLNRIREPAGEHVQAQSYAWHNQWPACNHCQTLWARQFSITSFFLSSPFMLCCSVGILCVWIFLSHVTNMCCFLTCWIQKLRWWFPHVYENW